MMRLDSQDAWPAGSFEQIGEAPLWLVRLTAVAGDVLGLVNVIGVFRSRGDLDSGREGRIDIRRQDRIDDRLGLAGKIKEPGGAFPPVIHWHDVGVSIVSPPQDQRLRPAAKVIVMHVPEQEQVRKGVL